MLFNSFEFIFFFLPITLLCFYWLNKNHPSLRLPFLILASLGFYTWWHPPFLILLILSIIINYAFGILLNYFNKKLIVILGIVFNIGFIGYYKYIDFLIRNYNFLFSTEISPINPLLPLAISFFTFQQIGYLVDSYKKGNFGYSFLDYCFFVCFFPQLIAGPIVQHNHVIPQIHKLKTSAKNIHIGLCFFIIGLAKKVLIADNCALYATPIFEAANTITLSFAESWLGAMAYTLQLYFDFSGYSDMAIGLGRMFNIHLPINFNSPYQANSIIDFWRRWHITLSDFLKNYLYIPLGGNKHGKWHQMKNLLLTMLLGGLWHGANWTFVAWGVIHGCYLVINHTWQQISPIRLNRYIASAITLFAVCFAWVYFRSSSLTHANQIIQSMIGHNEISLMKSWAYFLPQDLLASYGFVFNGLFPNILVNEKVGVLCVAIALCIALFMPNTNKIMALYQQSTFETNPFIAMRKTLKSATVIGIIGAVSILMISKTSEFLYFQF